MPDPKRRLRPAPSNGHTRAHRGSDVAAILVRELDLPTGPQGWQEQQHRAPAPHLSYTVSGDGLEKVADKAGALLHREEDRTRTVEAALDLVREERDRALVLLRELVKTHSVPPALAGPVRTLLEEVGTLALESEVRTALGSVIAGPYLDAVVDAAVKAAVTELDAGLEPKPGLLGPHPGSIGTGGLGR